MIKRHIRLAVSLVVLLSLMVGAVAWSSMSQGNADAAPGGKTLYSVAAIDANSNVQRRVLLEQGVKTMPGTTPVPGETVCIEGDADLYAAELTLVGTIGAGTAPVLTVALQNSIDGGVTWRNVGSAFAAINSTVTPAAGQERVTFADQAGAINTATVYGSCFRVLQTWAGTAATTVANVGVTLHVE
jgi:hypothetical protein